MGRGLLQKRKKFVTLEELKPVVERHTSHEFKVGISGGAWYGQAWAVRA